MTGRRRLKSIPSIGVGLQVNFKEGDSNLFAPVCMEDRSFVPVIKRRLSCRSAKLTRVCHDHVLEHILAQGS